MPRQVPRPVSSPWLPRLTAGCLLLCSQAGVGADLIDPSVAPATLTAGETTNYTISFVTPTPFLFPSCDGFTYVILNTGADGPNLSAATLVSISENGGSSDLVGSISFTTPTRAVLRLTAGFAPAGTAISYVIANVTNPGVAGPGPNYRIDTTDGCDVVDTVTFPGNTYAPTGLPTVIAPIPDQTIAAEDGEILIEVDLNNVFIDGNGDPLTFSIDPGHDVDIVTARVDGNQLLVTGVGAGTTTVTVRASDLPAGEGEVTDAFEVTSLGLLTPADVQTTSLFTNSVVGVVVSFRPSTSIVSGDQIVVLYPPGFDPSGAALDSVVPGTATLNFFANPGSSVLQLSSGSFASGANVSIVLTGVRTPSTEGNPGDYVVRAQDAGNNVYAIATIPGDTFVQAPVTIFVDGFEQADAEAKALMAAIRRHPIDALNPYYDPASRGYRFLGEFVGRDDQSGRSRSPLAVTDWLHAVLLAKWPAGDWDQDGVPNHLDADPLGLGLPGRR